MSELLTKNDWISSSIANITLYQRAGGTPSVPDNSFYNGDIPFVIIEDITKSFKYLDSTIKFLSEKGIQNSAAWKVGENHILYSMYATVGKPVINRIKCATNQAIIALKPSEKIDIDFLYYALCFIEPDVYKFTSQTTQSNLNAGIVKRLLIHHPENKIEQQKIATILTSIDTAIEKTAALIQKYQLIKVGLMHDLFTRGVTSDGKLRPPREQAPELYQETAIGWIPKEWQAKKLKEILQISGGYLQTGPFGSQLHAHEYTFEGVPVVMPQDINGGKITTEEIARIPEYRARTLGRHRLKIDDIIIARRGDLSRAATIYSEETGWICGTGCFLLRLAGSKLNSRFFSYIYRHDIVQRQIAGLSVGSTMPSLNNGVMNALYFPFIDQDEQNQIVDKLDIASKRIDSLLNAKIKLEKQKQGLMQDLLTGKVQVKVKV